MASKELWDTGPSQEMRRDTPPSSALRGAPESTHTIPASFLSEIIPKLGMVAYTHNPRD